jgi:hypothetical protein
MVMNFPYITYVTWVRTAKPCVRVYDTRLYVRCVHEHKGRIRRRLRFSLN